MTPEERAQLVTGWIEHNTRRIERDDQNVFHEVPGQDNFWAWDKLTDLCRDEPAQCWELILEILRAPHHESVEWSLAAGPLEDLLARHGAEFIDRIEAQAASDPKFKVLLNGVWRHGMPSQIWARVEAARREAP